jgi:hypothetical protein
MGKPMSRRMLIERMALAVGGGLAVLRARPAVAVDQEIDDKDKINHKEAQYQQQPKGQQRCEICLQFNPPNTCKIVQAPINPKGWCQFFAARENAH